MMQLVTKWCVRVNFADASIPVINFIVNDSHLANVLTHVAKISFDHEVFKIDIWQRKDA